ncbi:MAG: hypothetical protein AAGN66_07760 [Acidobacteriota bacterium]
MSYLTYKVLHLFAGFFAFFSVGGLVLRAMDAGTDKTAARKLAGMCHGIAMLLLVVSGFGLMARLGIPHNWAFPPWIWGKLAIWTTLGIVLSLIHRRPELLKPLWFVIPLLGGLAAWLALYKP